MMSVATVKYCRTKRNRQQARARRQTTNSNSRQRHANNQDVYSIYTNDPPPYDVVIKEHRLPAYSAEEEQPPTYSSVAYSNHGYDGNDSAHGACAMTNQSQITHSNSVNQSPTESVKNGSVSNLE